MKHKVKVETKEVKSKHSDISLLLFLAILICIFIANETGMNRDCYCRERGVSAPTLIETFRCSLLPMLLIIIGTGAILKRFSLL